LNTLGVKGDAMQVATSAVMDTFVSIRAFSS